MSTAPDAIRPGEVHSVTTARTSLAEDQAQRTQGYLIQMGIRAVCFALALFVLSPWRGASSPRQSRCRRSRWSSPTR